MLDNAGNGPGNDAAWVNDVLLLITTSKVGMVSLIVHVVLVQPC